MRIVSILAGDDLRLIQDMLSYEIHDEQTTPASQKLLQHDCFIVKETAETYMPCFHRDKAKALMQVLSEFTVSVRIHHQ